MRILLTALAFSGAALLPACATQTQGPGGSAGTTDTGGSGGQGGETTTGGGGSGGQTTSSSTSTTSSSSSTSTTTTSTTTTTTTTVNNCGNGVKEPDEQCEGNDFGGKTCESIGFAGGQLVCNAFCAIVASGCTPPENCNNSQDDDNDFMVDCADPDCSQQPVCLDSCAEPVDISFLPYFDFQDTTGRPAVLTPSCAPGDGPELVFAFTAPNTEDVIAVVYSFGGADFTVSVRTACNDPASEIFCQNAVGPGDFTPEQFKISAVAGQTYFIVIDGVTVNDYGSVELDLSVPQPEGDFQCDNHSDDDVDGYLDCDDASNCQLTSECIPGDQVPGAQCFTSNECMADADDPICLGPNEGFLDGYCSEFCDLANPSCGGDGICVDTATTLGKQLSVHGVCLDTCTGPGDCRPGYDCVDRNLGQNVCMLAPEKNCEDFVDNDLDGLMDCQDPDCKPMVACTGGAKAAGQPCVSSAECFSNASDPVCLTQAQFGYPGGYCSQFCNPGINDCGIGAYCADGFLPVPGAYCLDTCVQQADCRVGYSCVDFGLPNKICIF